MKRILSMVLAVLMVAFAVPALAESAETTVPKYVFMFIGDGMGSPQISMAEYYKGTIENPDAELPTPAELSFSEFETVGLMTTYDATSFCPDSASTATSMASGNKTLSGVINYDIDLANPFKLITEYAKEAGKKVGVLTSVSLDHATPAAYYAKVPSRSQYYDIMVQGVTGTTLDFLGGGGILDPDGEKSENPQGNIIELAQQNGFTYANTVDDIKALNADSGRVLAITPELGGSEAMQYELDRTDEQLSLSDMTSAAINVLDNENGFFLMVEGGKIDWTGHANDAATEINETLAFSDAVQVAIDFYNEHPDETLIIVTGDHETGGLTIGFATTAYDTHLQYLANQKMSYEAFDGVIATLRENGASFEDAMAEVTKAFGLTTEPDQELSLTEDELARMQAAYELSMTPADERELTANDELLYGGYEPLSMTCCHILNNKAGIAYTSYAHTGLQIPVYAQGVGADSFEGSYDNTDIFNKTMTIMGLSAE